MKPSQNPVGKIVRFIVFCTLIFIALAQKTSAFSPPNIQNPNCFFNTVASRLLSSELNLNLSCLQIYPTNAYTPAVNRLLQVTANIYDATTTNYYPSVFRPIYWKTNELMCGELETNVYIVGYQCVQEPLTTNCQPIFYTPTDIAAANFPYGLSTTNNVYGIPWILGAKKGLPNFNALEMENCFFIERQLQFNRNSAAPSSGMFPYGRIYTTNQMYIMGVSNIFGAEFWNSYTAAYTAPVTIVAQDTISVGLTNDEGVSVANVVLTNAFSNINVWPGNSSTSSFILPLGTSVATLPLSPNYPSPNNVYVYYYGPGNVSLSGVPFTGPCFIPTSLDSTNFLDAGTPPLPNFGMTITNRLQAYIIDSNDCILDYVQLGGMNSGLNASEAIADPDNTGLWSTNYYAGNIPFGVLEQYLVSLGGGAVPAEDSDGGFWTTTPVPGTGGNTAPPAEQAYFQAFFSASSESAYDGELITNETLAMLAPFTPTRLTVQKMVYAANDPLVHYLISDLNDFADDTNSRVLESPPLNHLGVVSDRYMPWGTAGNLAINPLADNNAFNLSYKDPLVYDADDWDFPTNETLNSSWLGQIHRGTPWQTVFLKSTNILELTKVLNGEFAIGFNTWQLWTGDTNLTDAVNMAPVMDWRMAGLLASLFNTNNIASLFSVNNPSPTAWENLLNGMTVLTNDVADSRFSFRPQFAAGFGTLTISSNSSQAANIAGAIQSARVASPGQIIANVGDLFAIPQLSDASPYLNVDSVQSEYGISDIAYEAIPDQLLPLLWEDSIGSIVSANGQMTIQFTGDDNHAYAVQVSSNLVNWITIGTNCPINGSFIFTNTTTTGAEFYRSILLQ
jgi:hypothetical protein